MKRCTTILAFAAAVGAAAPAFGFVQTMTCTESGLYACSPGETAKPVRWPSRCVQYYVNEDGTTDIGGGGINADTLTAIQTSFNTWSDVSQSDLRLEYAGLTDEDRAEYIADRSSSGNANVVMWRDTDWPSASQTAFAITSVTFDPTTGLIADADIEFNGENHQFTVGDTRINVDVQNTLTHEAGHFLGLDHTPIKEATMFGSAPQGEIEKRMLHPDDIAGLVSIYPATGESVLCTPLPEYFEQPLDEEKKKDKGCCTTVRSDLPSSPTPALAALLLAAVAIIRKRTRQA